MPPDLIHIQDTDLDAGVLGERLLAAFRAHLPRATEDRRGVAILAPREVSSQAALMVLARKVGAALRDANIALRDGGGDVKARKQRLCYLPGSALGAAFAMPDAWETLAREAACFLPDLDRAWAPEQDGVDTPSPAPVLGLLDARLAASRPTFLTADPSFLPPGLEDALRARLPILE